MKNLIFIVGLNFILPLLLLIILPGILIRSRQGTSNINSSQLLSFINNKPVEFSFISNQSNLHSLSVDLKNPQIQNNSRIVIDINGPTDTRSVVFYGSNVGDPSTIPLKFTPFSDPESTVYQVIMSTDNADHSSLYIITDNYGKPIFKTFYRQSDLLSNLTNNLHKQLNNFTVRNPVYTFLYLSVIAFLNYYIFLKK